jgi:multisubunit Na+/H+ antiporter MnhG subunit
MAEATTRTSRWRLFRAPESAGAIYGTIAAMAVIAGTARDAHHGQALALTIATLFVFWLAHVYAHALAHHLRNARRLDWSAVRAAMVEEWNLLQGPVPLLLLLVLGELGVLEERLAIRLALWLGVVELVGWAILYARGRQWPWLTALTAGAVNGLFGLVIVVLEVVVH